MKKTLFTLAMSSLSTATLLAPGLAGAAEVGGWNIGIRPRLEGGLMYYDYEQSPVSSTKLSTAALFGSNYTQKKLSFNDIVPTLSGGLTLFVDRFFIDVSALRAYNGDDGDIVPFSEFNERAEFIINGEPTTRSAFASGKPDYDIEFDRNEYGISAGYSITQQLAIFAGYRWTKTDFKTEGSGPLGLFITPDLLGSSDGMGSADFDNIDGFVTSRAKNEFKYDGPFIGLAYGLDVNQGLLRGNLSFNFALAFLDGEVNSNARQRFIATTLDGVPFAEPVEVTNPTFAGRVNPRGASFDSRGDTVGLTFGVNWRGDTTVQNLSYSLSAGGYRYDFDANKSENPDITETAIYFRAGLAYDF